MLKSLIDSLNCVALEQLLLNIFQFCVKPNVVSGRLFQDKFCSRALNQLHSVDKEEKDCRDDFCKKDYLTKLDELTVETGFIVFLIFQRIDDMLGTEVASQQHRRKNRSTGERLETKSRELAKMTTLVRDDRIAPQATEETNWNQPIRKDKRFMTIMKAAQQAKATSELPPEEQKKLIIEQREFFSRYVASLEVLHEGGVLVQVHFQVPYFCQYITEDIKKDIIWNANRASDQERLEGFFSKVSKYEYQMKKKQELASKPLLFFIIKHHPAFLAFSFIFILIINVELILGRSHPSVQVKNEDGSLSSQILVNEVNTLEWVKTPLLLLEIIQLIICALLLFVGFLDSQSRVPQAKSKMMNVWQICTDKAVLWSSLVLLMSICGLSVSDLFYQIIIIVDLLRYSRIVRKVLLSSLHNYFIIGLTVVLVVILVYFYGIVAFERFPSVLDRVSCW